jgi:hypothetical protein
MRERLVRLAGTALLLASVSVPSAAEQAMQIPYDPAAAACYRDLRRAPVLGSGIEQMQTAARREAAFAVRLHEVQELRSRVAKEYRALPAREESMREESSFVCAADDLLEAMFSGEAAKVQALPAPARASRSNELLRLLRGITLDPQWNEVIRARIGARLRQNPRGR